MKKVSKFWFMCTLQQTVLGKGFLLDTALAIAYIKQKILEDKEFMRVNTRAKRLRMRKVYFKLAVANANFTTRMPVFELKSNFISIQNFKAGNVKPPGMHWSKDF